MGIIRRLLIPRKDELYQHILQKVLLKRIVRKIDSHSTSKYICFIRLRNMARKLGQSYGRVNDPYSTQSLPLPRLHRSVMYSVDLSNAIRACATYGPWYTLHMFCQVLSQTMIRFELQRRGKASW